MRICLCGTKGCRPSMNCKLRHQHGFLHCLTISLSLRNTGTTTLSLHQDREEHCEYLSLLHYRNVLHSVEEHEELEELLELVAEDHRDAHNEEEEPSGAFSSSSFSLPPLPSGGRGGPVPGLMLGGRERLAGMDLGAKP